MGQRPSVALNEQLIAKTEIIEEKSSFLASRAAKTKKTGSLKHRNGI